MKDIAPWVAIAYAAAIVVAGFRGVFRGHGRVGPIQLIGMLWRGEVLQLDQSQIEDIIRRDRELEAAFRRGEQRREALK